MFLDLRSLWEQAVHGSRFRFSFELFDDEQLHVQANTGQLAKTLAAVTSTATAQLAIQGTASKTLGTLTSTATGQLLIQGALSKTLGTVTSTATGQLLIQGTLAKTLGACTSSATGQLAIQGSLSKTLGTLTGTDSGQLIIQGSLSKTLEDVALSATGTVEDAQISGTLSKTLAALTCSATGKLDIAGSLSKTLGSLTSSETGKLDLTGSTSRTLGTLTSSAAGALLIQGSTGRTLGACSASSTGTLLLKGTCSKTLGSLSLSATGVRDRSLHGSRFRFCFELFDDEQLHVQANTGRLVKTLGACTLVAHGTDATTANLSVTLDALTCSATGESQAGVQTGEGGGPVKVLHRHEPILRRRPMIQRRKKPQPIEGELVVTLGSLTLDGRLERSGVQLDDDSIQSALEAEYLRRMQRELEEEEELLAMGVL